MTLPSFGLPDHEKSSADLADTINTNEQLLAAVGMPVAESLGEELRRNNTDLARVREPMRRSQATRVTRFNTSLGSIANALAGVLGSQFAANDAELSTIPPTPPPPILEPGICRFCYLVMRTPATDLSGRTIIFPLTNLIDPSGPLPDRVYAVCYQQQMPIDFARMASSYIFYSWQPISIRQYNDYKNTYPGGVPGSEGELLRQALGDYCEPGQPTYSPGKV